MAHRPEAAGARGLPRLRQFLADDLPGVDGQEDHGVAEHIRRRARIRTRCPEPGRRLGGGGTGPAVGALNVAELGGPFGGRFLFTAKPSGRSEEHTSELQSLMRNSYAVFCLKKKKNNTQNKNKR